MAPRLRLSVRLSWIDIPLSSCMVFPGSKSQSLETLLPFDIICSTSSTSNHQGGHQNTGVVAIVVVVVVVVVDDVLDLFCFVFSFLGMP